MWTDSTRFKKHSGEKAICNTGKGEIFMNPKNRSAKYYHVERVRYADTDAQGHVFFGSYYTYMDEALMAFLEAVGYPWARLLEMGVEIYYVASDCQHKGRSYFGDRLRVYPAVSRLGNTSLTVRMRVARETESGEAVVAEGSITGVFVAVETGRPTPIPVAFRRAVERRQGE
jgi:acyl-CoA thioester hydrolase